jgi:hypothetical protein
MNRPARRTLVFAGVTASAATVAAGLLLLRDGNARSPSTTIPPPVDLSRYGAAAPPGPSFRGNFSVAQARRFGDYQLYSPGPAFEGFPLTAVDTSTVPAIPSRIVAYAHVFSFFYGDCVASQDANLRPSEGLTCAWPLVVQNRPSCLGSLTRRSGKTLRPFRWIRGAAARFHDRLILAAGRTTVDLWGDRALVLRAARELAPVNRVERVPRNRLPPPASGTFEGQLRCDREVHRAG